MPPQSQSSGSRSSSSRSSKRRSKRKSKGKSNPIVKKTAAHDGANFWAMLVGFVCGLTLLLLIISLFSKPKINADLLAADDKNRADVATTVKKRDFDTFVENANIEQLAKTLTSMKDKTKFKSQTEFFLNFSRQQKILDHMMEMPLSEEYRRLAVLTRIKSTATMFWTEHANGSGESNSGIFLRELVELHKSDSDAEISFESRIELLRLNSLEAPSQAVAHAKEIYRLLADFPTNKLVHKEIENSLARIVAIAEERPVVTKILDYFSKQPKVIGDQSTQNLYGKLTDLGNLCDHDFFSKRENVEFTAKAGRDQLRDVCLDLIELPNAGLEILEHVLRSAQWMEGNGHYSEAIEIYNALGNKKLPNEAVAKKTKRLGSWGVRRCEAVGKPFELTADTYNGEPLNLTAIKKMPVLIVFWSRTDGTDRVLFAVERATKRWQLGSVKIISVQVEEDKSNFDVEFTRKQKEKYGRWDFCYDDGTGTGPIFSQVPSKHHGRLVLLDRQHVLYDVNVNSSELSTAVNSVLAVRSDESEQ